MRNTCVALENCENFVHFIFVHIFFSSYAKEKRKRRRMEKKMLQITSTFSTTIFMFFECVSEVSVMCSFCSFYFGFNCALTLAFLPFMARYTVMHITRVNFFLSLSLFLSDSANFSNQFLYM